MTHPIATTTPMLTEHETKLTRQAERLVGQTFYGTLLKQMHDSPFKSKMMDGGRGGEAFQPLMDQHMIDHMSRGSGHKLVKSIVKHITHREKARALAAGSTPAKAAGNATPDGSRPREESPDRKSPYPKRAYPRNGGAAEGETRSHVPAGLRA